MKSKSEVMLLIKAGLAILLFLCVLDMPYGFYQLVRFIALVVFAFLCYSAHEKGFKNEALIYAVLAFLFQPLFKIALGRQLWNIIDVIVGAALLFSVFNQSKTKTNA
jgi:predicted cation transporter